MGTLGVDTLPPSTTTELVRVLVPANSQANDIPFPTNSGRRMRHLIGIKTYTTFEVDVLPPSLLVDPPQGSQVRFTLRASNGEFLLRDMAYNAFRTVQAAGPGLRQKVLGRLPVDFDKSWVRASFSASHLLLFEFIYQDPGH